MNATIAAAKHACPACGGEAEWNPQKQALVCPYCGTTSPAEVAIAEDGSAQIVEHDLAEALRHLPDDARGWQTEKVSVRCQSCQAISVFDPEKVSKACDFCGATALVPQEEQKGTHRPESLIPMKVSETQVRESIRKWYGSHFWAPSSLGKAAMTDTLHGIYIPYWTFDAHADCHWRADSGTYYYETSMVRGKMEKVRKVRWTPASGDLEHQFDDELIPASRGVDAGLLKQVSFFNTTQELVPYDPKYLSGWVVERYQVDLVQAAAAAREAMDATLRRLCAQAVPGDTHRDLVVKTAYSGRTFKHVLVPLWLLTYRYGDTNYQVVINGQSGLIAGKYPLSWTKIGLAILLALLLAALYIWRELQ